LLAQRLAECGGLDGWRELLGRIAASKFLTGKLNGRGHERWRADFDFVVRELSFQRIREGIYDDQPDGSTRDPKALRDEIRRLIGD
jgi:hypothetical protein